MPTPPVWRDNRAVALILAAALITMANSTISPALPWIEALFADHPNAALLTRLLVPAPSITVVICAPFVGILADRFGRRRLLLAGLILYILAGAAPVALTTLPQIFVSRLVMGLAVALTLTSGAAMVGDMFTGDARADVLGLQVSSRNFGGMLGILGAGVLAGMSPRLPFAIYLLAGIVLVIAWRHLHDTPQGNNARADQNHPATANWWGPLAGICALQMATTLLFFVMPTQMPFYLQSLGHDPALTTGLTLGALTLAGALTALRYRAIATYIGTHGVLAAGFGAMAVGLGVLAGAPVLAGLTAGAALVGIGFALVSPALPALALQAVPGHRRGAAMGALTTSLYLGQILSPFVSQALITGQDFFGLYLAATVGGTMLSIGALAGLRRARA